MIEQVKKLSYNNMIAFPSLCVFSSHVKTWRRCLVSSSASSNSNLKISFIPVCCTWEILTQLVE